MITTGVTLVGLLLSGHPPALTVDALLFWAFVTVGERFPVTLVRGGRTIEVTPSTTFAFAGLLWLGTTSGVLVLVAAAVVVDVSRRRPTWMVLFNAVQMGLSLATAGLVLGLLTGQGGPAGPLPEVIDVMPAVIAGAATFFVTNFVLALPVVLLGGLLPLRQLLTEDLVQQAITTSILLSLSPLVVAVAEHSLALLPLMGVPLVAVYRSAALFTEREHQALHDSLTDLPNRALFSDRTQQAVRAAARRGEQCAVMLLDLDNFKDVNDTLGHRAGDVMLQEVARRVAGEIREADTVARLGGDEFGLVLTPPTGPDDAEDIARRLLHLIAAPLELEGLVLRVETSIGIALYPVHGEDAEQLMSYADAAMYDAKRARTGVSMYVPQPAGAADRMVLLARLRTTLDERGLVLHYQPKYSNTTGEMIGAEALLRWPTDDGWVPPGRFIPIAEQSGVIRELTRYVLDNAVAQAAAWRRAGWPLRVAVNVSVRDVQDVLFPDEVAACLDRHGVAADCLELEITEHVIMSDPKRVDEVLRRIHDMGVTIAVDDFGAGATSLSLIGRLPIDALKIDRSFVVGGIPEGQDRVVLRSTIDLGHRLGLEVVAEGIEDQGMLRMVSDLGCDASQGFYLSRPKSAEALTATFGVKVGGPVGAHGDAGLRRSS